MTSSPSPAGRRRRRWILAASVLVALIFGLTRLFTEHDPTRPATLGQLVRPGDAKGFNLLLVTLDTTRQDRLGCYGYERAQTPTIDSLVNRGVRFDDAVTSVPLTLPSHATMLTGLHPPSHGVRDNGLYQLMPEHVTLTETLKSHGYDTAAFIACFVVAERYGLAQGFDVYDFETRLSGRQQFSANERPANAVTDAAIRWLDARRQSNDQDPFFAWVHYFDPHTPYDSPLQDSPRFRADPYSAEIAFVDHHLKRLLDKLDRLQLRERTLIALVCDHGEALGEHHERTHGMLIYEETMKVGFILSCPALFDGAYRVDDRVVGLVDLRPTIQDLLGIALTTPCDGQSLLATDSNTDRSLYIETMGPVSAAHCSPLYGLRRHTDKYILAPTPEYYDLARDSEEARNRYPAQPAEAALLARQLAELMEIWNLDNPTSHNQRTMTPEETARLASLGYVRTPTHSPTKALPDPKDIVPHFERIQTAIEMNNKGRHDEAVAILQEVLSLCDTIPNAYIALATIHMDQDEFEKAADILRRLVEFDSQPQSFVNLAIALIKLRRYDEAETALAAAEALDPLDGQVPMFRGDILAQQGQYPEAIALYKTAIEIDKHRTGGKARDRLLRLSQRLSSP